jgi:hypothetical protein
MKRILMIVTMLIVMASPVLADTYTYCANDTYAQTNRTMDIAIDGNSTIIDYNNAEYCVNGCSEGLGECRPNASVEAIILLGLIAFMIGIVIFTNDFGAMNLMTSALVVTASVILIASDVFSSPLDVILLVIPIAVLGEYMSNMIHRRKEEDDE